MKSGVYILINETKSTDELLEVKIGCSKNIDNRIKQIKSSFRFNGNLKDTNDEMKNLGLDVCDEIAENAKAAQRLS